MLQVCASMWLRMRFLHSNEVFRIAISIIQRPKLEQAYFILDQINPFHLIEKR